MTRQSKSGKTYNNIGDLTLIKEKNIDKMKNRIGKYTKHYYTGNHLSSTQLVTDGTGVAIQQVEYAPFGEVVNEYNIDWSNGQVPDFKFNAKELDEENGMYYFEARYQSPPVFISRDPLFEKYFWISPYSAMMNNPLRYNDPTGMAAGDPLKVMKIRRNATWNLMGEKIRQGGTRNHQGVDYYAPVGTEILAVKDGKVVRIENNGDYGLTLTLEFVDDNGRTLYAFYAHLSEISVELNQVVKEGDVMGKTGKSGNAAKNLGKEDEHLHFELRTTGEKTSGMNGKLDPNKETGVDMTQFMEDPNNKGKVIQVPVDNQKNKPKKYDKEKEM